MDNKRLEYLLNHYVANNLSASEEMEFFAIINSQENDPEIRQYLDDIYPKTSNSFSLTEDQSARIFNQVLSSAGTTVVPLNSSKTSRKKYLLIAASFIGVMLCAVLLFKYFNSTKNNIIAGLPHPATKPVNDVLPGKTGAILKLANGSSILLDSAADGNLATQGNVLVFKKGGSVNYTQAEHNKQLPPEYNTIETPAGRQFQLVLEDGTKVWLNAASSIRFPVYFFKGERRVEIKGEAYFEVAKNKAMPFRVAVNNSTIEVLGTHFNINAYDDEALLKTTLLEGSVKVITGKTQGLLKPGQQSQVSSEGDIKTINNADLDEAVAWKNGRLTFTNADLGAIMRQVKKWYNVEVVYSGKLPNRSFTADISRNTNLSQLLQVLELSNIHFKLEGKKLTVMP
jgi:hypothetical protein